MWWLPLLKKIALARLSSTGPAGRVGGYFLSDAWNPQKESQKEQMGLFSDNLFARRINPITGEVEYSNSQDQQNNFFDLLFKTLLNNWR